MSLKLFHIVFITLSTLLCLFMVVWGYGNYRSSHEAFSIALAFLGAVGILLLVPYGRWFWRKMKGLAVLIGMLLPGGELSACLVCYGDPGSPAGRGLVAGVLLLGGVVGVLLATILTVGLVWRKRARLLAG